MSDCFFSGSYVARIDDKGRFVFPQKFRYQFCEGGKLDFTVALSMGGVLAIYRPKEVERIVEKIQSKKYSAKHQKFITLFFSTMMCGTLDKIGRVTLSNVLLDYISNVRDIVIAGALNKFELWPKSVYYDRVKEFFTGNIDMEMDSALNDVSEDIFSNTGVVKV